MKTDVKNTQSAARERPQASEVERLCSNSRQAELVLDWKPEYSGRDGFTRGLEQTVAWFHDPANLGRYKSDQYNISSMTMRVDVEAIVACIEKVIVTQKRPVPLHEPWLAGRERNLSTAH